MSDPLALLPLAVAAGGGAVDGFEAQQLVAAGLTLLRRSAPLVRALQGRRSAVLLPTSPAFLTALAASDGRGAVLVNPLASPAEVAYQLADANVGAAFTNSALAAKLPAGVPHVLLDEAPRTARVSTDGVAREIDLAAHTGLELEGDPETPGRDEEAAVVYTSAMAGRALGATLTHRNLLANGRSTVTALGNTSRDHVLALLPFAHLFGLTCTLTAPLLAGARVTTVARFHPGRAVEVMESGGVTEVVGVPAVYQALLGAMARRGGAAFPALRLCVCGGAPLSPAVQDAWANATGVELRQGYGLTEAGPVCLFNRVDRPNRRGTLGVPFPDVEVAIADAGRDDVAPLSQGSEGEICVRGDNVFRGYLRTAPGGGPWTAGLPVRGGWLRTGDLGVANDDGTFAFRGFLKPMFTRNGFNIYPREIELVIGAMPDVRAVSVRPIPEPLRENDIAVRVTGGVTAAQVRAWCAVRLGAYKQPSDIEVSSA